MSAYNALTRDLQFGYRFLEELQDKLLFGTDISRPVEEDVKIISYIKDALADGKVVPQGGIPSVLVCEEGATRDDFVRYVEETVLPLKGRKGFMSDNIPPNADFTRIELVAEQIKEPRS